MSKGSKEALTVSIVTYVTHVDRVESSSINSIRTVFLLCRRCRKMFKMVLHICVYNFFNIQWIFNPEKVLESLDLALFNRTIKRYLCQSMLKGSKVEITFDPLDIHHIWLERAKSQLSKTFFGLKIC